MRRCSPVPWLVACCLAVCVVGSTSPARGDKALTKARGLFKQAEVSFNLGDFDKALELYREAYRTKQLPEFLFNIGQCHRHKKEHERAAFHFRQFLREKAEPPPELEAQVTALIEDCEQKLAEEKQAQGIRPVGSTAGPVQTATRRGISPVWFWTGVGLTGAFTATALATGLVGRSKANEAEETSDAARARDLDDKAETMKSTCWAMVGAGSVAALGTVLLYFLTWPGEEPGQPQQAAEGRLLLSPVVLSEGGGMLTLGGRF